MKLNITVDMEDLFSYDDEGRPAVTETIEELVIKKAGEAIAKNLGHLEKLMKEKVDKQINETLKAATEKALEKLIIGLLDEQITVTDDWGKPKYTGTIREKITGQFKDFLTASVDKDGRESSYSALYTRAEWFAKEILKKDMAEFTKTTVETIKKAVKEKLTDDLQSAVGREIVNSIGVKKVIDQLQIGMEKKHEPKP